MASPAATYRTSASASTGALRDEASLNIVVPMGGSGEAFREAGYTAPKPMIKIAGRPMLLHLLDSLRLRLGDVVWLIIPSATYLKFASQLDLNAEFPTVDIRVCTFTCSTHGAAETVFIGLQHMTPAELSRRTLCLDCDTLYFSDVLSMYRSVPSGKGMCAYFIDRGTAALYSYLRLNEQQMVAEVREKNAISDLANIGAYGFASGALLRTFIQEVLDSPQGLATEYFLSHTINKMIAAGHEFAAHLAEDCAQCGTPDKLEQFMSQVSAGKALTQPKRRFCFALDNVLVTPPTIGGDMSTVQPIEKNIQLVRELKASGHYIIISTSRLMQECGGNVGAVVAACGNVTLRTLEALQIPYDEIHFGQPFAHVYVDASVACSALDTEKDLGWRVAGGQAPLLEPGMIAARHFNNVQLEGDYVVKTAAHSVLRGEIFFYEHLPSDIAHLFPQLVSSFHAPTNARSPTAHSKPEVDFCLKSEAGGTSATSSAPNGAGMAAGTLIATAVAAAEEDPTAAAATAALASGAPASGSPKATRRLDGVAAGGRRESTSQLAEGVASMTLSRVKGVTFSHLVTNRSLTPGRLVLLLKALRQLHSSAGDPATLRPAAEVDLAANYLPKLRKRYTAHRALYSRLSAEAPAMYARIEAELTSYAAEQRWQPSAVIHGDPVFSNVLLTEDGRVYLLDMRGEVGSVRMPVAALMSPSAPF